MRLCARPRDGELTSNWRPRESSPARGAGKAWPKNKSAVFYLYYARGKVPRTYSLPYTHHMISEMQTQLRFLQISNPPDPKDKFRVHETKIKEMHSKLDPELDKLVRAISDFADEASAAVLRPKEGRAKERQDEKIKESDARLTGELAALATRIGDGGGGGGGGGGE